MSAERSKLLSAEVPLVVDDLPRRGRVTNNRANNTGGRTEQKNDERYPGRSHGSRGSSKTPSETNMPPQVGAHSTSSRPKNGAAHQMIEHVLNRRSRTMIITLLIGYFVGIADVLVSAQLPAIAFINIVIGAGTIAVLYDVSNRHGSGEDLGTCRLCDRALSSSTLHAV